MARCLKKPSVVVICSCALPFVFNSSQLCVSRTHPSIHACDLQTACPPFLVTSSKLFIHTTFVLLRHLHPPLRVIFSSSLRKENCLVCLLPCVPNLPLSLCALSVFSYVGMKILRNQIVFFGHTDRLTVACVLRPPLPFSLCVFVSKFE